VIVTKGPRTPSASPIACSPFAAWNWESLY
jgi:hypothetical protein